MPEFECKECGKKLYSEEALQQHTQAKHTARQEEKKESGKKIIKKSYIAAVIVVVIIGAAAYFAMTGSTAKYEMKTPDEDNFMGAENATVTVTEFSDFQCPFCFRFFRDTEPQIKKEYIDTGKVKFVYKHFPIPTHSNAQKAAEASECAADIGGQDAFWQMHDKMFQNNNLLSASNLKRFAAETGLNMTDFNLCLDSGIMRARVARDNEEGRKLGVTGTPAFFVNGQKIEGAQPFSVFKSAIDGKL